MSEMEYEIAIVGAGSAGISVASRLVSQLNDPDIVVIDPRTEHYYQPLWTLVGAGIGDRESTAKPQESVIPAGADWLRDAVVDIDPESRRIDTAQENTVYYDYLVVAPGIQLDWDAVPGLEGSVGTNGICSNYGYGTVETTQEAIESFDGGTALFTQPDTPIKCPGAPQKILYLADDRFREKGVRQDSELIFSTPTEDIFGVEKYAAPLRDVVERKNLDVRYQSRLKAIEPEAQRAVVADVEGGEEATVEFDFLHVTPPQSAPDFLEDTGLLDAEGWVDVDKGTLRHRKYERVFSLGDASNLPTSKTAAAVRKQAPVLVKNLLALRRDKAPEADYEGYTACPVVTGTGSVVMAEFDYEGNPRETFPFDQGVERRTMFWVKRYLLPVLYWQGMLKGRS